MENVGSSCRLIAIIYICLIDYIRLSVHVLLYGKGRHKAGLVRKKILYC